MKETLRRTVNSDESDNDEREDEDGRPERDHRQSHPTVHRVSYCPLMETFY